MINNTVTNNIIFFNYLENSWKEEKHIAWKLLKKNNIFFNNTRKTGLLVNKNSNLNYKQKFLASILSRYLYSIKQHLKLYSIFLLFFRKLKKSKFFKKNYTYIKKKRVGFFRKFTIRKYKKCYFMWYKKWFRRKYKKNRRILWKSFHKIPDNFWGRLLKKRSKFFIFNILKISKFKKKVFFKNYNEITKLFFFFIRRRKGKRTPRKKLNKKYRINVTIPIFLQKIKYLQEKQYKQEIFPKFKKKKFYLEKHKDNLSLVYFNNDFKHYFYFFPKIFFFFTNYSYYNYFLNLKNKYLFDEKKNVLKNYYKTLSNIYKKKKNKFIRTNILDKNFEYSNLKYGNIINIFFYWQDLFFKKYMVSYKYIFKNLLNSLNKIKLVKNRTINNFLKNKIMENIIFIIKKKKTLNSINYFKHYFLFRYKEKKKNKIKYINLKKEWYKNLIKRSRKIRKNLNLNRKMYFYPYRVNTKRNKLSKKKRIKKLKKIIFKKKKKKNKYMFNYIISKKIKKKELKSKKKLIIKKYLKNTKKHKYYININKKSKINILLKKKRHFLKKYKRKLRKKIYFLKYKKIRKFGNKKKYKPHIKSVKNKTFFFKKKYSNKNKKINFCFCKKNKFLFKKRIIFLDSKLLKLNIKKNTNDVLKYVSYFLKKKILYKLLFNLPLIYKEFLLLVFYKIKRKKYSKYKHILKYIKYKISTDTGNIFNNLSKYNKLKANINNVNNEKLIYNFSIICPAHKNVYSKLLNKYHAWINTEINKTLFFKWINIINNNNTNVVYRNNISSIEKIIN